MSRKKVKNKTGFKPVRLTDKCSFDCRVNPINGSFVISIEGQVANIRDYILPLEMKDVAIFASTLAMMSLLGNDSFKKFSIPVAQNPEKYFTDLS